LVVCCVGSGPRRSLVEGTQGLHAPAGHHRQILQVDRSPTLNQHRVRAGGGVLYKYHPSLRDPKLHHHRQWHAIHWGKVPRLLRRPPHPSGLGRRSSPNDKRAGGARQWHDFAGTKAEDLQRPQQVWQAVDKRATLGGLESKDDAEPGHRFLAVLSSLWGRGRPTHGLRIRFPEDKGIRRPKQPGQPRRFNGPARRGSGRSLTTLGAVSAVSATLPRPKDSAPRLPSWRFGASATTRRPRAPQAYSSLGRAVHHRQSFEARDIQDGQRSRRGLQQRLEHRTSMSLLPIKCFKSFMYLDPFTCINKSLTVKGGSALPQQKTNLPRGLEGGTPYASKFSSEKFSTKTTFVPFEYIDNGVLKTR
jgi:hypothetical protein